jgi:hypothetical protein
MGVLAVTLLVTVGAALVGDATLGFLVAPIVVVGIFYMMWRAPLRHSLMALMFCAFTLENPNDAPAWDLWRSPLYPVGAVLLTHLNNAIGVPGLSFSGMDVCLAALGLIALYRRLTGSRLDRHGRVATPTPLLRLAALSLAGTAYVWISGMVRGGDFRMSLWQVEKVFYLPVLFLLFQSALRGPRDHGALARVVLGAATVKACVAIYVDATVSLPPDAQGLPQTVPYATTHHDSMLFAIATVLLAAMVLEGGGRRARRLLFWLLPVLVMGMVANNRRMVWVQIALVFVTLYLSTPATATKRKLNRVLLFLAPLALIFLSVGWDTTGGGVFKPVQIVRSVLDPQTDKSAMWREIENYNILYTIRQFPLLGTGYGYGFWEMVPLPEVQYDLERYCPHNSILGLLCYAGYFGFTAMTLLWGAGVYFGMRAYHATKRPTERAAALTSFGAVLIYMVQCWGDMGLGSWIGVFTVAPAIAVAGKLAVKTGAWSTGRRSTHVAPTVVQVEVEGEAAGA